MHEFIALLTLVLGGADAPPGQNPATPQHRFEAVRVATTPDPTGPMIAYEIRYATIAGVDWRGRFDHRLKPVARDGGTVVWSADQATHRDLLAYCQADTRSNVLQAPRVVTPADGEVSVVNVEKIAYVAHLDRVADGPVNQSTKIAFKPEIDHVRNGIVVELSSGRVTGQGLLAHLTVKQDRIVGFDTTVYSEKVQPDPARKSDDSGRVASALSRIAHGDGSALINGTIQVPLVDSSRVDGYWVIPTDGVLIVGLGPKRLKGKGSREAVTESLVLINYGPAPGAAPTPVAAPATTAVRPGVLRGPVAN